MVQPHAEAREVSSVNAAVLRSGRYGVAVIIIIIVIVGFRAMRSPLAGYVRVQAGRKFFPSDPA